MTITNGYLTLAEIKVALGGVTGSGLDADLERAIEAASRSIDEYTRRRFWQDSTEAERFYTADDDGKLVVDDISTTTNLVVKTDAAGDGTYETTWTRGTDFRVTPINAAADGEPWTVIERITVGGRYAFPSADYGVSVTAKFGWAAVPTAIEQACLIEALRLFKRKDSPFGVAGSTEFGAVRLLNKMDPDAEKLIKPFRRIRLPGQRVAVA